MNNKNDYKNVYVFAEQRGGVVQSVALELIGKARDLADALGEKVVAILAGYNVEPLIQTLFEYGADEVVVTDHPELKDYVTEEYAQAVEPLLSDVTWHPGFRPVWQPASPLTAPSWRYPRTSS